MDKSEVLKRVKSHQKQIDKLVALVKKEPKKSNFAKLIMQLYCQNYFFKIVIEDPVDGNASTKIEEQLTLNSKLIDALKLSLPLFK